MKAFFKNFALLAIFSLALFQYACKDDKGGTFYGEAQHLGNGHLRTYVTLNDDGEPVSVGVSIDKAATEGLSQNPNDFHHNSLSLIFPEQARISGYDHVLFDWNPFGHEPAGIYTLPHFDVHFYTQSVSERSAIPPFEVDSSQFKILPASDYFPPTYFAIPGGVPGMGVHWIDGTAPELNGQKFTHTFIYGSYNGKNTFWEPMITLEALQNATKEVVVDIKQPAKYPAGYYPMQYTYVYDAQNEEYRVTLSELVKR